MADEKNVDVRQEVEAVLDSPIDAIEEAAARQDAHDKHHTPADAAVVKHSRNETVLFGRTIPLPIYTVVFLALAFLTVIEVLIGTAPHGGLTVPALVVISGAKAVMVVMFYMHLRDDSKIFTMVLVFPLVIALIAVLFLLLVPPIAYPG